MLHDQVSWAEKKSGELKEVFRDGKLLVHESLKQIRQRVLQVENPESIHAKK